jgi:hypothetical protein
MADNKSSRDRKRTPDVLAELLSPDLPPAEPAAALAAAASPASTARTRKAQPREVGTGALPFAESASETWQVEIVSFQDHRGWRPRYVNGIEVKDWLAGPVIHDYVNLRGAEGWRLAGATSASRLYGAADGLQLYFRRRK